MKREEVILRAYAKKISWIDAAGILGMSPRHLLRVREKYQEWGFDGLQDARVGKESPRRVPVAVVEEVIRLYRDEYFDFNVRHFHEKLVEKHLMTVSYTWVKALLQGSGLVAKDRPRKKHRRRRERKPLEGMMEHIDGSKHQWFGDDRWFDLIVILDDATSKIYYAQLVDEESTMTVMEGIREVIEKKGVFCSLYSDRASHFFRTSKAGEPVDRQALTQVGRALRDLGIQLIPAYSPQARGRSERSFRTWQGRLPQELRIRNLTTLEDANRFLKRSYIREFNRKFTVEAAEPNETAFVPCNRSDLDRVFSIQTERTVNRDNTVKFNNMILQIDKQGWRRTMEGCRVTIYQHFDDTITIGFGPQQLGKYSADGSPIKGAVNENEKFERKVLAPFAQTSQTGHIMC
jgi:Helix-turn-helix domain